MSTEERKKHAERLSKKIILAELLKIFEKTACDYDCQKEKALRDLQKGTIAFNCAACDCWRNDLFQLTLRLNVEVQPDNK